MIIMIDDSFVEQREEASRTLLKRRSSPWAPRLFLQSTSPRKIATARHPFPTAVIDLSSERSGPVRMCRS